jgi:hypothetical protein
VTGQRTNVERSTKPLTASAVAVATVEGVVLGILLGGGRWGSAIGTQIFVGAAVLITVVVAVAGVRMLANRTAALQLGDRAVSAFSLAFAVLLGLLVALALEPTSRPV